MRSLRFTRYALAVAFLQMALGMVAPLFPLFWVRSLGATDAQISIVVTVYSGTQAIGSLLARRFLPRIGREWGIALGALGFAVYPLLASFSPSIWWMVPWAAVGGVFFGSTMVTMFDNLVAVTPEHERTTYIAVYNMIINGALFLGPVLAAVLVRVSSPALGLRVAAVASIVAAALFVVWLRPKVRGEVV